MSGMKATIEKAAEMLGLGYTEHEIVRILSVPPSMAEELIQKAEQWNDELYVPYTEKEVGDMAAYYGED
jgi:ribosomal protein L30/L7E